MAVPQDLARISFLAIKAMRITEAALANNVLVDPPGDLELETQVVLTPAQKITIFNRRAAVLAELKALAASLPGA